MREIDAKDMSLLAYLFLTVMEVTEYHGQNVVKLSEEDWDVLQPPAFCSKSLHY